eukprot:4211395-Amphidinium_carterae.1
MMTEGAKNNKRKAAWYTRMTYNKMHRANGDGDAHVRVRKTNLSIPSGAVSIYFATSPMLRRCTSRLRTFHRALDQYDGIYLPHRVPAQHQPRRQQREEENTEMQYIEEDEEDDEDDKDTLATASQTMKSKERGKKGYVQAEVRPQPPVVINYKDAIPVQKYFASMKTKTTMKYLAEQQKQEDTSATWRNE